ncbi:MAG: MFS transporter [Ilumatobacter sp.]|uniref:MFS transporter n=1 Tax=Ilumatobacter sp. TaxID=1967498 RepID=UPI002638FB85|nr:MFS transporter [Ilumatobacter sp.]MDJ0770281.1 MFS transporter [Ilumatobacter sp.]
MTTIATTPLHHGHEPGSARAALSYRDFRILFAGTALSSVGTWMQNFTLPAYVDARTNSAALVGLLMFVQLGPLLLLSIPSGIIADRVDRTRLVIAMQSVMLVMSIVLAALIAAETPLWTVFVAQLTIGIANTVNAPAFSASIPMLVDRRDLAGAVSLNSAMINGSRIMGPALAALLAALGLSIPQLFLVNAGTFLFLIVPLVFVALPQPTGNLPERGWRKLASGINIVRRRRVLARTVGTMFLFSLVCLPYIGLFPSVARLNFGLDAGGPTYKWLYVVWGLGAFLGALAVGTWFSSFDKRRLIPAGLLSFSIALGLFAVLPSVGPAFPVALVLGFVYFMTATALASVLQQNLADHERGAAMPLWFMAFGGTVPIGNLLGGPIMDAIGARWVLGFGAAFAVFLAWWANLGRLAEGDFLHEDDGGEPFRPVNANRLF